MIDNLDLLKKVLAYIYQHEGIILDEAVMNCKWGFNLLEKEGYIEIKKGDNEYFASLTDKGIETLMN
jgi:hypothetical protein